ncbi:MAG TPA: trypsin-like peptidase domain-containing protein, partial [Acidobacteriota bacterium]|nr:trypsin-like peptidase domain-containing protein [Acidobacteriota bacterium]
MSFFGRLRNRPGLMFVAMLLMLSLGVLIGSIISIGVESAEQKASALLSVASSDDEGLLPAVAELQQAFRRVADVIEPAVVNISTTSIIEVSGRGLFEHPDVPGFFPEELWRRFFGESPDMGTRRMKRQSLGSGVIVDESGYVLTNFHVIAPVRDRQGNPRLADKIEAQLKNGAIYRAEVVGWDENNDLAVLRLNAGNPLPAAKIGDSSNLR